MQFAGRYTLSIAQPPTGKTFEVHDALCGGALVYQGTDLQEALQGHGTPELLLQVMAWAQPTLMALLEDSEANRAAIEAREESDTQFRKALLRGENLMPLRREVFPPSRKETRSSTMPGSCSWTGPSGSPRPS